MPAQRKTDQSRRRTAAGLIAVTAGTLLMMTWVILPTAAFASTQQTTWNQINGAGFVPCSGTTLWIFTGLGNDATHVSNVSISVNGGPSIPMPPQGNNFKADVPGPATNALNTNAVVTWTWDDSRPVPTKVVLTISHCTPGTTTTTTPTTTTTTPTTTTTTPTTTTKTTTTTTPTTTTTTPTTTTKTTTTTTPTTTTTTPTTTTTTPGGGGGGGTTTTTTTIPTVAPTTVHNTSSATTTDEVLPTTVRPGGTAFTGVEDVVPIGTLALILMTSGSGLLWAGARRRRHDGSVDED